MTDDTQPEAMDLADWLEAVGGGPSAKRCAALLREQHARIAELESELEAMDAGGVQALSAAPRTPTVEQVEDEVSMGHGAWDMVDPQELIGAVLRLSVAASPTPPAEQQVIIDFAQVGTAGPFHVVNGRVKLPDATMQDLARMLRPTYEAEQAAPKVDGFYEAVNDMDGLYQAAPKAAPGEPRWWRKRADAIEAQVAATGSPEAMRCYTDMRALLQAVTEAAPQQEAQEPVAWLSPWRADQVTTDYDAYGERGIPLYTAPQPAPAPPSDDSALLDWIAIHGSFGVDSSTGKVGGNGQKCVAATRKNIRAAIAAQRGNK